MKKLILSFTGFLLFCACAYAITPPASVVKSFEQKFPNATKVRWGKESSKEYEAEFTLGGKKISANFSVDGQWLETEQQIRASELPKAVQMALNAKYPGWKIREADMTDTVKNGQVFEADIAMGSKKKSVSFKGDGTIVKE